MYEQNEKFDKEIEAIKKKKKRTEILAVRNTVSERRIQ